ncbi:hypothetical protein [Sphingomonas colocasiae]|uniref:Uncharacterized protein n=1 Tax=Sphingomonas colocasiae TaxID=1848973 RepID=A0ABS7PPP8_9SPHN|nr:hypothetical protein [Sphingomonas colocasiae]MBY8823221.1 hypothetical protein [Sphingomonas colocasiae]
MSGPKVVRIVTREELIGICQGQLARVDAAIADWIRIGRKNAVIDDADIAATRARRDALAALIAADRFADLQKQAPVEAAFLRDDLQRRLEQAAKREAQAKARQRREREAAQALLNRLRNAGAPLAPELENGLRNADPAAVSQALLLLTARETQSPDHRLAARLRDDAPAQSFQDWLKTQPASPEDPAIERIETRIAEIARTDTRVDTIDWHARLAETAEAPKARRDLILDALEVETGRALTAIRQRARAISQLRLALAEAEAAGMDMAQDAIDADTLTTEQVEERTATIEAAITTHRAERALAHRRAAVLQGLSGLGYEVTEGMSTAWATEGRLVLRSTGRPDYGVELSGGERVQMRPVAFDANGTGPDPSRDRDAEQIWCSDVTSLDRTLEQLGDDLVIEQSIPVGTIPLKRIRLDTTAAASSADIPTLRERTLR